MNQSVMPLIDAIKEYDKKNVVPFDVPGHKHGVGSDELVELFGEKLMRIDVNSMKCLDNIANPVGVIKDAEALLANAYGCDYSFYLINGTTSGVQSMIMSVCGNNDKIILPRNVHKSAINALILSGAHPVYIQPKTDYKLGISMGVCYEDVCRVIDENTDAKAIFIINPTYYGAVSNLKKIIDYAHKYDIAVLVDEAHGAHFAFHKNLPQSAMKLGADMSAVSLHKTGGALTQASALLLNEGIINKNRVRSILNLTQSTSASYLLMASLDGARKILATRGDEILENIIKMSKYARCEINKIDGMYAFGRELVDQDGVFDFDETKLGINVCGLGLSGFKVYDILRDEYNIQMELCDTYNVLAILSLGDTKENIQRLIDALCDISKKYKKEEILSQKIALKNPKVVVCPRDAFYMNKKSVALDDAIGHISGEYVMAYPPGIPIISPGELITYEIIEYIKILKKEKTTLTDSEDSSLSNLKILCDEI